MDKVCLITGPTHGIGEVAARRIAAAGYRMILACRDVELGASVARGLAKDSAGHEVLACDLASLEGVAVAIERVRERCDHLDLLVNNAGCMTGGDRRTDDGHELMMQVNHIGHFMLTTRLLPLLEAAPNARVVIVASRAHYRASIDPADPLADHAPLSGMAAYSRSKLANVMFSLALAERLKGGATTVNCLHPGVVATNLMSGTGGFMRIAGRIAARVMLSSEEGAHTMTHLALSHDVEGVSGRYFDEHQRESEPSRAASDTAVQRALWDATQACIAAF